MTRDDIVRMAREAGWSGLYVTYNEPTGKPDWKMVKESLIVPVTMEQIERFAALVAAHEREACAQVCEETTAAWTQVVYNRACMDCATAIRNRAEGEPK